MTHATARAAALSATWPPGALTLGRNSRNTTMTDPLLTNIVRRALALGLLLAAMGASAARIEGQSFEDRVRLADTDLVLNGVGLRAVAWFKGYAAGLYIARKAVTAEDVLAQKGPKRVQMKMMVDVETKEFTKAFDVGMKRNNTEAEQAAMKDRMAQFDRTVDLLGKVKKGDVVNLDFVPGQGLILSVNGTPRGTPIPGEDLYAGLLKIFIGDNPVDKKLRAGLLGAAPA